MAKEIGQNLAHYLTSRGRITDSSGNSIPDINIFLFNSNLQGNRGKVTNNKGYLRIISLPIEIFKVKISVIGFSPMNDDMENVEVKLSTIANCFFDNQILRHFF